MRDAAPLDAAAPTIVLILPARLGDTRHLRRPGDRASGSSEPAEATFIAGQDEIENRTTI